MALSTDDEEAAGAEPPPDAAPVRRGGGFTVDPRRSVPYRMMKAVAMTVLHVWFRPRIRSLANFPRSGPAIVAPVHRSNVDFAFAGLLTDRKLFFMAKEELWQQDGFGRLLESLGAFPVNRSGTDRESIRRAEEVLRRGELLVMFPEGSRRFGHRMEDLQEGVAFLAARTGAPIVPVGISGTERAMPKGAKFPKPVGVTLSVGEPITVPAPDGRRIPRREIHALTETLRERLQAVYDDAAR